MLLGSNSRNLDPKETETPGNRILDLLRESYRNFSLQSCPQYTPSGLCWTSYFSKNSVIVSWKKMLWDENECEEKPR
jgi:hypothetical protein